MSSPDPKRNSASPEGDVVYRRVAPAPPATPPRGPHEPRFDPTLMPLLVGCALLLLFVLVLGNLSIRRVQDTTREVLMLEQLLAARAELLLQLRIALTRLDNEARDKMEAQAREELRPPFDMRLNTARSELMNLMPSLDRPPLSELPKWQAFRRDLGTYIETTKEADNYSLNGFAQFQAVDRELNELILNNEAEQRQVFERSEQLANAAVRSIKIWTIVAVLAGLFVTAASVLAAQRRYLQTRESVEAARREREFSNQMLEGMVSAVAAIDRHDRIRSANSAFFKIFPGVAIGSSIHDQNGSPESMKLLEAATASHVVASTYRGRWNLDNGITQTFDVYSSPIEIDNENGQILTLVDVTEAAKSEAALRRTEALAAVGEAAAQLAHEIKNPLGSIRLGVEMLREYTTAAEAQRTITLVERGIQHLNKLVVDVTQFSRRRELDRTEVDLHDTIDASLDLVADRIKEKETPIEKQFVSTEISGEWDGEQLSEVFVNIFANAIDASEPRAPVKISTELINPGSTGTLVGVPATDTRPRVRIEISDQGAGMDEKTVRRLFEPFFTTKKRGTGLGLSIVRQIIDLHGGSIDVQSERGKGTTFTIELPLNHTSLNAP